MYVQYCDTVRRNYVGYSQLAQINNLPALFVVIMLKRKPFIWKLCIASFQSVPKCSHGIIIVLMVCFVV